MNYPTKVLNAANLEEEIQKISSWPQVFQLLGSPELAAAANHFGSSGGHQCPFPERHSRSGGKGKFRLYPNPGNAAYNGRCICSCTTKGQSWSNGYTMLMDDGNYSSFYEMLKDVNRAIGSNLFVPGTKPPTKEDLAKTQRQRLARIASSEKARAEAKRKQEAKDRYSKKALHEAFAGSFPITHPRASLGVKYLMKRGLSHKIVPYLKDVRFHPGLNYIPDKNTGKVTAKLPCLLILFRNKHAKPITMHRLFMDANGVKPPENLSLGLSTKQVMPVPSMEGMMTGGAMRLSEAKKGVFLNVCEGPELGIAILQAYAMRYKKLIPTWSCYSDSVLAGLDLDCLKDLGVIGLNVFADKDVSKAGEEAANELHRRCTEAGLKCNIHLPEPPIPEGKKGIDWEDMLIEHGHLSFPDILNLTPPS